MWGGATRVPGPKELEGLTRISFPLNSAPMGITLLGFLMRKDKKGRGRDGSFPINIYRHSPHISHLLLHHAYLRKYFRCYRGSWDHHQIRPPSPSTQQDRIPRSLSVYYRHRGANESRRG